MYNYKNETQYIRQKKSTTRIKIYMYINYS